MTISFHDINSTSTGSWIFGELISVIVSYACTYFWHGSENYNKVNWNWILENIV